MRRILLILALIVLALILLAIGGAAIVYTQRDDVAEALIKRELAARGYGNVRFTIEVFDQDRIVLTNIRAGRNGGTASLDRAEIIGDVQEMMEGRIEQITLTGGTVTVRQRGPEVWIGGHPLPRGGDGGDLVLPELRLVAEDVSVLGDTDYGKAALAMDGTFDLPREARISGRLQSDRLMMAEIEAADLTGDIDLNWTDNGPLELSFAGESTVSRSQGDIVPIAFSVDGSADEPLAAMANPASASIKATFALSSERPTLPSLSQVAVIGPYLSDTPLTVAQLETSGVVTIVDQTLHLDPIDDNSLNLTFDNGATLDVAPLEGRSLLSRFPEGNVTLSAMVETSFDRFSPAGAVILEQTENAVAIDFDGQLDALQTDKMTLRPTDVSFQGQYKDDIVDGTATLSGGIDRLISENTTLRRFYLTDASMPVSANFDTRELIVGPPAQCLTIRAPQLSLPSADYHLKSVRGCSRGPRDLARLWLDTDNIVRSEINTRLLIADFTADFGETIVRGTPATMSVTATSVDDDASFTASLRGGDIRLNDDLSLTDLTGSLKGRYADGALQLDLGLNNVVFTDLATPVRLSPVVFAGDLGLIDGEASFNGAVSGTDGTPLGSVSGGHSLTQAQGGASLVIGPLTFERRGTQPADIVPAFKGFLENATGGASGQVIIDWSAEGLNSSGRFALENLTFNGPVQAITQTAGITMDVSLVNLLPFKTGGVQTAQIRLIDMDALKLEDGVVRFEAPGDGTLSIADATWSWFGGQLRVESARIPLDGGQSTVPMKVEGLELAELFAFLDIKGLSGEGQLSGTLPIIFDNAGARVEGGVVQTVDGGVLRYDNPDIKQATAGAGAAGELAFDTLRNFTFTSFRADIDGDLAGDVSIKLYMEGTNDEVITGEGVIYRVNIDAPLTALFRQIGAANAEKDRLINELSGKVGIGLAVEEADGD